MATTDQALLSQLQYALLEPPDGGQFWPSDLWTRDEVVAVAVQRQNALLFDTFLLVTDGTVAVLAGQSRVTLPDEVMQLVTVVWRGDDGIIRELPRADSFEADHAIATWESTPATAPLVYMEEETPLAQLQLAPPPIGAGTLDLLYVPIAPALTGNGVAILIPDELAPVLKYGILADLLGKEGRGQDPARAHYCERRVELGNEVVQILLKGWA